MRSEPAGLLPPRDAVLVPLSLGLAPRPDAEGEWPEHWVGAAGHSWLVARRGQVAPLSGMLYPTTRGLHPPRLCQGVLVFRLLQ